MFINKEEKIAVTGGTGFLGSHILRALVEDGFTNIYALRRSESQMGLVSDIQDQIVWVEGDILDIKSLEDLLQEAKGVIHSAAKVSYNPKDQDAVMQVNVEGTANVVNVCLAEKVSKLIFISSVAAIGRSKPGKMIDETTEWVQHKKTTTYGLSKHLAEMEVWRGMHEGLEVGILNPSMILGPSYWGDSSTKLFTHVAKGSRFYPPGSNGFVDVRDLASLSLMFLTGAVKNRRVVAVSEMSSYLELLTKIAHSLKKSPPSIEVTPWLSGVLWRLLSFTKDPAITRETVNITSQNFAYDNSLSKSLFDFTYRSIDTSITDTCEIYLQNIEENISHGYFSQIKP